MTTHYVPMDHTRRVPGLPPDSLSDDARAKVDHWCGERSIVADELWTLASTLILGAYTAGWYRGRKRAAFLATHDPVGDSYPLTPPSGEPDPTADSDRES